MASTRAVTCAPDGGAMARGNGVSRYVHTETQLKIFPAVRRIALSRSFAKWTVGSGLISLYFTCSVVCTTGTLFHMLFTPVLWAKKLFLSTPYFISVLMQTLMNPVIPGSHFL